VEFIHIIVSAAIEVREIWAISARWNKSIVAASVAFHLERILSDVDNGLGMFTPVPEYFTSLLDCLHFIYNFSF
jgi:hypothetical protein